MNRKNLIPFYAVIYAFFTLFSVPAAVEALPFILFPLFVISSATASCGFFFRKRQYAYFISLNMVFLSLAVLGAMHLNIRTKLTVSPELSKTSTVYGTAVYDSTVTSGKGTFLTVDLKNAGDTWNNTYSAHGSLNLYTDGILSIPAGAKVKASGTFSDNLFIADEIEITEMSRICLLRSRLIKAITDRLCGQDKNGSQVLSMMLITGKADEASSEIKEKAQLCGCMHVLALSGMHLKFVANTIRKIFGKKKLGKTVAGIAVFFFVFIAGPRPSLIRAALMFYLSFLPVEYSLPATMLIQSVLFPWTMTNMGNIYGYCAVISLLLVSPYLETHLPKVAASSVSVIIVTAPLQLLTDGFWYPVALVAGPVASLLAGASMTLGFTVSIAGRKRFLLNINDGIYRLFMKTLDFFSLFPKGNTVSFAITLGVVLAGMFIVKSVHGLELRLQQRERNFRITEQTRPFNDKKVRAEFSRVAASHRKHS